jgi:chemotaxis protein MotB
MQVIRRAKVIPEICSLNPIVMKGNRIIVLACVALLLGSCVSKKKYRESEDRYGSLENLYRDLQKQNSDCQDTSRKYQGQTKALQEQMVLQEQANDQLLEHMKLLSIITASQAESIKKSLENLMGKDAYIRELQSAMARKDSLNMVLVMNLKGVLGNLDDKDIEIKIDKGVIYIDISDRLLFQTGRYQVTDRAREVLGKVAKVLNKQPQIEFMVEGHTDTVAYQQGVLLDNWDLSVKRATSVIRILQKEYGVPPARITAAGRGEYIPLASNATAEGRAVNRRTRIVILPELDQFFKLLERPVPGDQAAMPTKN